MPSYTLNLSKLNGEQRGSYNKLISLMDLEDPSYRKIIKVLNEKFKSDSFELNNRAELTITVDTKEVEPDAFIADLKQLLPKENTIKPATPRKPDLREAGLIKPLQATAAAAPAPNTTRRSKTPPATPAAATPGPTAAATAKPATKVETKTVVTGGSGDAADKTTVGTAATTTEPTSAGSTLRRRATNKRKAPAPFAEPEASGKIPTLQVRAMPLALKDKPHQNAEEPNDHFGSDGKKEETADQPTFDFSDPEVAKAFIEKHGKDLKPVILQAAHKMAEPLARQMAAQQHGGNAFNPIATVKGVMTAGDGLLNMAQIPLMMFLQDPAKAKLATSGIKGLMSVGAAYSLYKSTIFFINAIEWLIDLFGPYGLLMAIFLVAAMTRFFDLNPQGIPQAGFNTGAGIPSNAGTNPFSAFGTGGIPGMGMPGMGGGNMSPEQVRAAAAAMGMDPSVFGAAGADTPGTTPSASAGGSGPRVTRDKFFSKFRGATEGRGMPQRTASTRNPFAMPPGFDPTGQAPGAGNHGAPPSPFSFGYAGKR